MRSRQQQVEYVANSRIGEKGQLTIPQVYRDRLGLKTGTPVAVVRVGEALLLIPEQDRLRSLVESITSVFERRKLSPTDLQATLPAARKRVADRRRKPGRNR